ncbi:acyltransferase family protein [Enterobacteriaceae bacterium RIT691]|nr:acyltransferase family protein [Enterobacteriaceae bacterium RIT691]
MKKITYLEGLRGICCFIVIIDHCINTFKPDLRHTGLNDLGGMIRRIVAWTPLNFIYSGIAPVCIFFILSGFVLSLKYNKTNDHSVILSGVIKRYPRLILPILAAMILMYVLYFAMRVLTGADLDLSFGSAVSQALYYAPFEHISLTNYALWTISFEIYGSFLVFGLLALYGSYKKRMLFYFITFSFLYLNSSFYSLFIFGMILNDLYINGRYRLNKYVRLAFFVVGVVLVTTPYVRDGVELYRGLYSYLKYLPNIEYGKVYQFMMLTGSMLLFSAVLDSLWAERILDFSCFKFLGKISFPLYITHAAVLTVSSIVLRRVTADVTLLHFICTIVVTIPVCFAISWIFEKYVDMPSINLANRIAAKFK